MRNTGGERVEEAVASAVAALRQVTDRDWAEVRAAGLEWSCRETAVHVTGAFLRYAGQLAGRAAGYRLPFTLRMEEGTGNEDIVRVVEAMGALLAATVRSTPREVRAYHPFPFHSADRDGFAAMAVTEVLVHTYDITRALGTSFAPPAELCTYALTRIFPAVRPAADPWRTLLWATGRGELPGRAPVTAWHWTNNLVIPAGRLTLEALTPAAAADLSLDGDGGFPWLEGGPCEGTRYAAGLLLKAYEGGVHRPEWGVFVIVRREDGRAVGGIGFHGAPDEEGRVEVGYDLVAAARGHGYATEALRALTAWALDREEVTRLFATVERDNRPSQAVLDRAGFRRAADEDGEHLAYELRG
jgi:RimJ/RimL family protein N-acetyltransferase